MPVDLDRVEKLFPTLYVTLINVLLGLALEDLLSQVRSVDLNDPWIWVVGLLSVQGKLNLAVETMFAATAIVASIAWISTFYIMWNRLLDRVKNTVERR